MKKTVILIIPLLLLVFCFGNLALAQDAGTGHSAGATGEPIVTPEKVEKAVSFDQGLKSAAEATGLFEKGGRETSLSEAIGKVLGVVLPFLSLIFLIIIVYAGLRWMNAAGNDQTVTKAKSTMIHAAIGLFVTLLAYQVTNYLLDQIKIVPE